MPTDRQGAPDPISYAMLAVRTVLAIDEQDELQRDALLRMFMSAAWMESRVFEQ
jgi:hypothetical protein